MTHWNRSFELARRTTHMEMIDVSDRMRVVTIKRNRVRKPYQVEIQYSWVEWEWFVHEVKVGFFMSICQSTIVRRQNWRWLRHCSPRIQHWCWLVQREAIFSTSLLSLQKDKTHPPTTHGFALRNIHASQLTARSTLTSNTKIYLLIARAPAVTIKSVVEDM
jgi:hypothetical protein